MYLGHMVQGCRPRTNDEKVKSRINSEDEWTIVKNTHDPIVEQEVYDMAKKRLDCNRYYAKENRDDNEFAGLLRCPDCGHAMSRIGGSNARLIGFQCDTYRTKSKKVCTRHGIRIEDLREAVLDAIKTQVKMSRSLYNVVSEICRSTKTLKVIKHLTSEIYNLEKDYEEAINKRAALYIELGNSKIGEKEYGQKKVALDKKIEVLDETISVLRGDRKTVCKGIEFAQEHLGIFLKYEDITGLNKNVLIELVDVIYVYEDGNVEVNFLHKGEHRLVSDFIGKFV
jgi:hypothetical protein